MYFVTTDTGERRALFQSSSVAEIVETKLFEYRGNGHYFVHSYVVMPEHLHVILTPSETTTLEEAVQLIKGGSSHDIGARLQSRFPVWHPGFTEHQIRDQDDFESHVLYIEANPVKARLAERPELYLYCSAHGKYSLDPWPLASGAKAQDLGAP